MRYWWLLLSVTVAGCSAEPQVPGAAQQQAKAEQADARRLKRACGSAETYDRLKEVAFEEAARVRKGDANALDRLAAGSVVRMERPVVKSRDERLNVTVCTGRLILELPPGAENAFDGDRRLQADVEYAAQEAVDGSGLVYQMDGAEPIIYRLATVGVAPVDGSGMTGTQMAAAPDTPPVPPTLPPVPVQARQPSPAPPVTTVARPAPPRPAPRPTPAPKLARSAPPEREADVPRDYVAPPTPVRVASARPSFDCRRARSRVERMVCGSDELARADRSMSSTFYAALARADGDTRAELRSSRDRFLRFRDRCTSDACVAQAYADRTAEIRDMAGDY